MLNNLLHSTLYVLSVTAFICGTSPAQAMALPAPQVDEAAAESNAESRVIVLAGGCFWGIQEVFQHVKGVTKAVAGYSGGSAETANYEAVGDGNTGHAEAVEVTYNPKQISAGVLLKIFFSVAHDPTTRNGQGPDHGWQYRSAVFFSTAEQENVTRKYIAQLDKSKLFSAPIVTEVNKLEKFYAAEGYHQNYARNNPAEPYIVFNDQPKVLALKKEFPEYYTEGL